MDWYVPSINHMAAVKRFQWKVLPQGMMNSPTICQYLISVLLQPIRYKYPKRLLNEGTTQSSSG